MAGLFADFGPLPRGLADQRHPKRADAGVVSPYLVDRAKPGTIVTLSNIEGDLVLPDPVPESCCSSAPAVESRRS